MAGRQAETVREVQEECGSEWNVVVCPGRTWMEGMISNTRSHDTREHDLAYSNHHASARHATTCHAAVCLHIASHAQHLETVLAQSGTGKTLAQCDTYGLRSCVIVRQSIRARRHRWNRSSGFQLGSPPQFG